MTVYSVARRRLPNGEQAVAVVEALAHDAELVMREMEERIGGDRFAAAGPFAALQDRFELAFAAHVEAERALVGRLQGPLTPAEHAALGTRLDRALRHAPTRTRTAHTRPGSPRWRSGCARWPTTRST